MQHHGPRLSSARKFVPRMLLVLASFALAVAAFASAPDPTVKNHFVVTARLHTAVELLRVDQGALAAVMAEKAAVTANTVADSVPELAGIVADVQTAVDAGDASAAAAAAQRADKAVAAAFSATASADDVTGALAELIRLAEHEAEEAVEEARLEPFLFARSLAQQASTLASLSKLPETSRGAIAALISTLGSDPMTAAPTAADVDLAAVESATDAALAAIGASPADADTERYFATIRTDLDVASHAYAEGDVDTTNEALIDAYLENFEYLEAPLAAVDAELMESIEHTLRDDLRAMVRDGAEPAAFDAAIASVLADLERAEAALE